MILNILHRRIKVTFFDDVSYEDRQTENAGIGRHYTHRHSFTSNRTWNALGLNDRSCISFLRICPHVVDSENLTF